jgi:hypothetical protein
MYGNINIATTNQTKLRRGDGEDQLCGDGGERLMREKQMYQKLPRVLPSVAHRKRASLSRVIIIETTSYISNCPQWVGGHRRIGVDTGRDN